MARRHYSDNDRAAALAVLEANDGNVTRAAKEAGVPAATLRLWRDAPEQAAPAEVRSRAHEDLSVVYRSVADKAAALLDATLDKLTPAAVATNPKMLAAVSAVASTATDKYYRLTSGADAADDLRRKVEEAGVDAGDVMAEVERILAGGRP